MSNYEKVKIGNATLYLGDCREILPTLEKMDAIVSDPPYGIGFQYSGGGGLAPSCTDKIIGDDQAFEPQFLFDALPKKRNGGVGNILLFGANHYAKCLPDGGEWMVWDKIPRCGAKDSFRDAEFMWSSVKTPRTIFRHQWKGLIREGEEASAKQKRVHVSQKPVALMMWCIDSLIVPLGGTVCDPFMGSGSTGVAALRSGRQFIGIEIDQKNFDTACERITKEQGVFAASSAKARTACTI